MDKERIKGITYVSLCVAVLTVISQFSIPFGYIPFTLQTFAVALVGYFLGAKNGLITVVVYIALGAIGAPVFSGLNGGVGVLISYTGGFIFGFIFLVLLCGIEGRTLSKIMNGLVGLILCHAVGTVQYMFLSDLDFVTAMLTVSIPYILKDIALVIAAYFVSRVLKKRLE